MGIVKAFTDSFRGSIADQWIEIITAGQFDEHSVVVPGVLRNKNNGRGQNTNGSDGVITDGSKIYVPDNTAAFIFSESAIEEILTEPGGYEYNNGEESFFNTGSVSSLLGQISERFSYGGVSPGHKRIAFVNLREIRNIRFGTKGPQIYHDTFYGVDLDIYAYGNFSIKVVDPELFIRNFVPANVSYYSFDDDRARTQIVAEFLQSFSVALNTLSNQYRLAQLPAHANEIAVAIKKDQYNAGTWKERFGLEIGNVAIENIEFSDAAKELVNKYSTKKLDLKAYEDVSQKASNIVAQQKIAEGIQSNGFGDAGGMFVGMNMAQSVGITAAPQTAIPFDEQIEMLKKIKDLLDEGVLTQEEFDAKKKEIMGL